MIKLENVTKIFTEGNTKHVVLDKLDLTINNGEIVVLLGKSGSGKSTLLNLISGIDIPDKGSISFDDTDIESMNEKERTLFRRKNIGFIFQFFNLIPTLTVGENLLLPLELNNINFSKDLVKNILNDVGLEQRFNTYPDKLSGGEQQRIAVARALIHEPEFILADEPTGNLDYETSLQVITLIDRLVKQKGKTMIMATHSPEVIGLADRIYSLKDGKLTETTVDSSTH
jgi:putative ABC transport system ATP-binding protein